jgi:HK97 family phage prohead protease
MKITIRQDSVVIEGYVNAVDRFSRPLFEGRLGRFIEKILPNVFKKAIQRAKDVEVLLNHDPSRKLASTADGTAKLVEDNVGLRATVQITDPEVIEKARAGKLRGWSFGFSDPEDETKTNSEGLLERVIKALTLHEVSIIDDRAMPAYFGTSIETRTLDGVAVETRTSDDTEVETETADGGEDNPDTKNDTRQTDDSNAEDDKAEDEAKLAEIEHQRLQREADIREASI